MSFAPPPLPRDYGLPALDAKLQTLLGDALRLTDILERGLAERPITTRIEALRSADMRAPLAVAWIVADNGGRAPPLGEGSAAATPGLRHVGSAAVNAPARFRAEVLASADLLAIDLRATSSRDAAETLIESAAAVGAVWPVAPPPGADPSTAPSVPLPPALADHAVVLPVWVQPASGAPICPGFATQAVDPLRTALHLFSRSRRLDLAVAALARKLSAERRLFSLRHAAAQRAKVTLEGRLRTLAAPPKSRAVSTPPPRPSADPVRDALKKALAEIAAEERGRPAEFTGASGLSVGPDGLDERRRHADLRVTLKPDVVARATEAVRAAIQEHAEALVHRVTASARSAAETALRRSTDPRAVRAAADLPALSVRALTDPVFAHVRLEPRYEGAIRLRGFSDRIMESRRILMPLNMIGPILAVAIQDSKGREIAMYVSAGTLALSILIVLFSYASSSEEDSAREEEGRKAGDILLQEARRAFKEATGPTGGMAAGLKAYLEEVESSIIRRLANAEEKQREEHARAAEQAAREAEEQAAASKQEIEAARADLAAKEATLNQSLGDLKGAEQQLERLRAARAELEANVRRAIAELVRSGGPA